MSLAAEPMWTALAFTPASMAHVKTAVAAYALQTRAHVLSTPTVARVDASAGPGSLEERNAGDLGSSGLSRLGCLNEVCGQDSALRSAF